MAKKTYWAMFFLILAGALLVRAIPSLNGNFYFTSDQARDMVQVREFVENQKILTKGPQTSIPGISVGPGWYYFLAIGYILFAGNPIGGVFLVILLSSISLALVMLFIREAVSLKASLVSGFLLSINWFFYDTSRYSFNPFPLVLLSFLLLFALAKFFEGERKYYFLGIIPIILAFNTHVAGAGAFLVFYALCGLWGIKEKRLSIKEFLVFAGIIPVLSSLFLAKQVVSVYKTTREASAIGTFGAVSFGPMLVNFTRIMANALVPQSVMLSFALFVFAFLQKKRGKIKILFHLTTGLFVVSYLWFSWSKGWKDWQTVYLSPLLFVSLLGVIFSQKKRLKYLVIIPVVLGQSVVFVQRYLEYLRSSSDSSILANQVKVLDWIYQNSEGDGFNSYQYLEDSEFDWKYQYLYWWYGREKYGFLPCEYSMYPKFQKQIFLPTFLSYSEPRLGCDWNTFLVIEPARNKEKYEEWFAKLPENTKQAGETKIGEITIKKLRRASD